MNGFALKVVGLFSTNSVLSKSLKIRGDLVTLIFDWTNWGHSLEFSDLNTGKRVVAASNSLDLELNMRGVELLLSLVSFLTMDV